MALLITYEELEQKVLELVIAQARMEKTDFVCPKCLQVYSKRYTEVHSKICYCNIDPQ